MTANNEEIVFTNKKPTRPGAYWLTGHIYPTLDRIELVRVEADEDGQLYACGFDIDDVDFYIEDASPEFFWSERLVPEIKCKHSFHYFGDYPKKRCVRCNSLEDVGRPIQEETQ